MPKSIKNKIAHFCENNILDQDFEHISDLLNEVFESIHTGIPSDNQVVRLIVSGDFDLAKNIVDTITERYMDKMRLFINSIIV
jgi:uncharacterized protein (UPF0297 family)